MKPESAYEDKVVEMMSYVRMRLDDRGVRLRIRDRDDIRRAILDLPKGSRGKPGEEFASILSETNNAGKFLNRVFGRRGPVRVVRKDAIYKKRYEFEPPKSDVLDAGLKKRVRELRVGGRDVFVTPQGGYAAKFGLKSKKGGVRVVFKDVRSGRFVSGRGLYEE